MYIKQVSRRDSRRPQCAVRPGPGRGGWPSPPRPGAGGSAPSHLLGPQQGARGLAAGLEAFASIFSVPGGGSRSRLGEVPPARPRVRSYRWLGWWRFLCLSAPVSFIAGVKWRWGFSFMDPRLVRGAPLYASLGVPAAEGSYPNRGLCSAVRGIFQLFKLWSLFFALGCYLRPPGMNHFTCYASSMPKDLWLVLS